MEQQLAFEAAADAMRRGGGRLSLKDLKAVALATMNVKAPRFTAPQRQRAAEIVAQSIFKGFDHKKSKPLPKHPRSEKKARDVAILRYYYDAKGKKPSIRDIASEFAVPVSVAHDVLFREGLINEARRHKHQVSESTLDLIRFFEAEFPVRGMRLLDFSELQNYLGKSAHELLHSFAEIANIRTPLRIFDTGVSTGKSFGSTWLGVQRGKARSEKQFKDWAMGKAQSLESDTRSRTDQRVIFQLREPQSPSNLVLKDAASVILIANASSSLRTWKSFIDASLVVGAQSSLIGTVALDPGSLLNAVNGAARLGHLDELLLSMPGWMANETDQRAAHLVFSLAETLRIDIFDPPIEAVSYWARETQYRERIEAGLLPGRSVSDFDMLMASYQNIETADELLKLFKDGPRDLVLPWFYACHDGATAVVDDKANGADVRTFFCEDADHLYPDPGYIYPPDGEDD